MKNHSVIMMHIKKFLRKKKETIEISDTLGHVTIKSVFIVFYCSVKSSLMKQRHFIIYHYYAKKLIAERFFECCTKAIQSNSPSSAIQKSPLETFLDNFSKMNSKTNLLINHKY